MNDWKRFWHQAGLYRRWLTRRQEPYQALFVIATGRSGSNLLLSYLNEQPGVALRSELLHPRLYYGIWPFQATPSRALRHLWLSLQADRTPIRGCKLMLNQLENCRLSLDGLRGAFPDAKYIILYRENLGEQFVSDLLAKATHQFLLLPGEEQKLAQVHVNPAELQSFAAGIQKGYREVLSHSWLAPRSVLLSYEELVRDPEHCLVDVIGPLLGIKAVSAGTHLRKQNSRELSESVANYAEIAELLVSTRRRHAWPRLKAA